MRKISTPPALTKHIIHNYDLLLSGSDEIKPDLVVLIKVQYDWKEESAEEDGGDPELTVGETNSTWRSRRSR